MTDSVNNKIPYVPENTIDPAAGLNIAINAIDALLQCAVISIGDNDPPSEGVEGDRYIVGPAPTGEWEDQEGKLAHFVDAAWDFYDARFVLNTADGVIYTNNGGIWMPATQGRVLEITGTSYELTAQDANTLLRFTNSSPITMTINSGVAKKGLRFPVEQAGTGQVTLAGTATIVNYSGHTKTAGQYAKIDVTCSVDGTINFSGQTA